LQGFALHIVFSGGELHFAITRYGFLLRITLETSVGGGRRLYVPGLVTPPESL
jgi:hypothetical protein